MSTLLFLPEKRKENIFFSADSLYRIFVSGFYSCRTIALGNGTACRETEKWLSDLFSQGILDSKQIRYCIVNEQGTSIYSCSDLAKKEFPQLDVNLISAGKLNLFFFSLFLKRVRFTK